MKEIDLKNLHEVINPFSIEDKPAIALASDGSRTNGLTIGWAGFGVLWNKLTATVYVHRNRFSKEIFDKAEYFSICYVENKDQLEYFGTVSGRTEDKIANCDMKLNTSDKAPYFEQSKLVVICRIMGKSDFNADYVDEKVLAWYKRDGVHTQYYGQIIKVLEN